MLLLLAAVVCVRGGATWTPDCGAVAEGEGSIHKHKLMSHNARIGYMDADATVKCTIR